MQGYKGNTRDVVVPATAARYRRSGTLVCLVVLMICLSANSAMAQNRFVVRDSLGLTGITNTCLLLGCTVQRSLGDPAGQLFLVKTSSLLNPVTFLLTLVNQLGIVDAEFDQPVKTLAAYAGSPPPYLTDEQPVTYYGTTVWHGYVAQPANQLINTDYTHSTYGALGAGVTVAVIDTGVDPYNPVLQNLLVAGYDFTRNVSGGSERSDVSTSPDLSNAGTAQVNQSTAAVLDQSTAAVLDGSSSYAAFGHGTMVSGIVHLVAPQAKIMPLKSFTAAGAGYDSDILRAIYYAVKNGAKVLNMSFSYTAPSQELANAIKYANSKGVISVASAGNDGQQVMVYPGGLPSVVDVASTSNQDVRSTFSNYGAPPVWLAAPGEGVVTTYPWGTYAAGWGTSFSTPFVAGTAAIMLGVNGKCSYSQVASGLAQADWISDPQLGNGRLDTFRAVAQCH
jgi:subtilisin family serine protease